MRRRWWRRRKGQVSLPWLLLLEPLLSSTLLLLLLLRKKRKTLLLLLLPRGGERRCERRRNENEIERDRVKRGEGRRKTSGLAVERKKSERLVFSFHHSASHLSLSALSIARHESLGVLIRSSCIAMQQRKVGVIQLTAGTLAFEQWRQEERKKRASGEAASSPPLPSPSSSSQLSGKRAVSSRSWPGGRRGA